MTYTSSDRLDRHAQQPGLPRIAVDLLGGDDAPAVVVDGALLALNADPDIALLLVGPTSLADEVVAALDPSVRSRVSVRVASRRVGMTDPVSRGSDPQTSIGAGAAAVAAGEADALVSAGATGAIVAASVLTLRRLPGVRRPALTAILPGTGGPLVLLDVGAGMQVSPADLVQYAVLGAGYARLAAGVSQPRIGLLSVGHEPGKGDRLRRAADAALRVHPNLGATYVGPVEGHDVVLGGRADVVVSDGFTGNVLLKAVEAALGTAAATHLQRWAPPTAIPRAGVLLGIAGAVVIAHGAASAADVASGIGLAASLVRDRVTSRLAPAARELSAGQRPSATLAELPV